MSDRPTVDELQKVVMRLVEQGATCLERNSEDWMVYWKHCMNSALRDAGVPFSVRIKKDFTFGFRKNPERKANG